MHTIALLILFVFVGGFSVLLDRLVQNRHLALPAADTPPTGATADSAAPTSPSLRSLIQRWWPLTPPTAAPSPQAFRTWAVAATAEQPALQAWLRALTDEGMAALTNEVAAFCREMEMDLPWLLEQQLEQEPALKQAATQMVLHYCTACYQGVLAQESVHAFKSRQTPPKP